MRRRDWATGALGLFLLGACNLEPKTFDEFGTGGPVGADAGADAAVESESGGTTDPTGGVEGEGGSGSSTDGSSGADSEADSVADEDDDGANPDPDSDPDPDPDSTGTDGGALPACGDGVVDEGEECDDGDALAGDGCSHHCAIESEPPKRVFITSATFTGAMGGLAGADAACQSLADAAALSGTYLAWLADGTEAPAFRFERADVPYILVDGTPVAESWADLVDGTLMHAIDLTEAGSPPPIGTHTCGQTAVWSNVTTDGGNASAAAHCAGWTDVNAVQSHSGRYDLTGADWSASCFGGGAVCLWTAPIYCFEQ
jgi:cysteine-rich repeat protein